MKTHRSTNPHAWYLADLPSVPKNGMKVMSTFACGGGSSMGYKLAGFEVVAANDIDPQMASHYQRNLNPRHYFLMPIGELVEKARARELPDELYDLDILDGSPPCSSFSTAGKRDRDWGKEKHFREGQAVQVLDDLFFDYLNLVDQLRPKVSIAENVKGMILGKARGYTKMVLDRYQEIGYRVQLFLLNAADCGVPQMRERVFFVAVREDIAEAHDLPKLQLDPKERWVTVREAIEDLAPVDPAELTKQTFGEHAQMRDWWQRTAPGELFREAVVRSGGDPKLFNWRKFHPELPGYTLTAFDCTTHWSEPRLLTFAERVRIGAFPDDYEVESKNTGRYLIGMSVPPRMTERVASAVRDQWLLLGDLTEGHPLDDHTARRKVWDRLAQGEGAEQLVKAERGGKVKGQFNAYRKIHPDLPANTMTANDNLFHYDEPRTLSAAEKGRVSSFPEDYEVENETVGKYMTGMSVPPRMTEKVAAAVRDQWLEVAQARTVFTKPPAGSKVAEAYAVTQPGDGLDRGAKRLGWVNADGTGQLFNYRRAHLDLPSPTVPATTKVLLRPERCEPFAAAEVARLQSFPDDYRVASERLGLYLMGMSVPPRMMQRVAEAVREWLRPLFAAPVPQAY